MRNLRYIFLSLMTCTLLFVQAQNKIPPTSERYIPKAIDLGLPSGTIWADRNMSVNDQPTNFGEYYSWGNVLSDAEMTTYDEFNQRMMTSWKGYKYGTGPKSLTKYCTNSSFGTKDNKTRLDPDDDAATAYTKNHKAPIWDAQWHIPTDKEFAELIEKCKWEWKKNGYQVTGPNGKSIFLPAAGFAGEKSPSSGYYWTSSLCPDFPCYAYAVMFGDTFIGWNNASRYQGYSIRPVKSKK
ncbi:MAG: hypothetical protein J5790_04800 [Bacteroidaceae bacterium]|nr:hypothetical protein [Bacteroidaceae bacterium]